MPDTVLVAIISGLLTLLGTCVTVWAANRRNQQTYQTSQAVMAEQIRSLTAEVREHNNFARRMPVVEEQIKVINHRIEDLEHKS